MKWFNVDFRFHNVGQGLFYTGKLKYGKASFTLVYDCGSEKVSLVNNAIARKFRRGNRVDLLIISHLHKDHANGIPYLLKRTRVRTVILPYLSPLERLIVALATPFASREYYDFLADPVTYLIDNHVERVMLVGGEEPDRRENWVPPFEEPLDLPFDGRFELMIDELPPYEKLAEYIEKEENIDTKLFEDGRVEVRNHVGVLKVSLDGIPIWTFRFFNHKVEKALPEFKDCIKKTLGKIDSKRIKDAIKDPSQRRALKHCYNKLSKNVCHLNNTSLITLHFPIFRPRAINVTFEYFNPLLCRSNFIYWRWGCPCLLLFKQSISRFPDFVQFLTGDVDLNYRFNDISQHFGLGKTITDAIVTLVPHHGSHHNWNNSLCRAITSDFWIISAGIYNRYGHPSLQTLWDICMNCKNSCVVWVNEVTYFRFRGVFEF
ncbi:MBL fold metallo-hydrolase [Pyrococcus kukulkanii]|uniref:Metallo-beta-lactamase domain-containing protein n=1 Tax=Pyrococcus kukulkanii TaxID=1609559 RepID=A0A127B8Q8_9EURY|nr:MBL fold metallo-hydrolase [Pyrococcus kukulkanii]AMM53741.1 hypothetical protein TQ32_04035 [Pyrococcus kukulkanii]